MPCSCCPPRRSAAGRHHAAQQSGLAPPTRPRGGTGPTRMAEVRQLESAPGPPMPPRTRFPRRAQAALVNLAGLLFDQAEGAKPRWAGQQARHQFAHPRHGRPIPGPAERTRVMLHLGQAIDTQTKGEDAQTIDELERTIEAGLRQPAGPLSTWACWSTAKDTQKAMRNFRNRSSTPALPWLLTC